MLNIEYIQYVEHKVNQKNNFVDIRVSRSKFDEKRLKMAAMTRIFFWTFWKIDAA